MKTLKGLLNLTQRSTRWLVVAIILAILAYGYFVLFIQNPYTTDAVVQGNWVQVAAEASGQVTKLYVQNNQSVTKGQLLFEMDATIPRLELLRAKSALAASTQKDRQQQQLLQTTVLLAQQKVAQMQIKASATGTLSNFYLRSGTYVHEGVPLFSIIEDGADWWVEANYLEFELRQLKVGQQADIHLSMYPNVVYHGQVSAIAHGISRGRTISPETTLPVVAESINWLRLFSRFPVFIHLENTDPQHPLRIGATAAVTIHAR